MGKYYAVYKCPMCNKEFRITDNPVEMDEDKIPEVLGKVIANQRMLGNPYLYEAPLFLPHKCGNGDGGLARLIGFRDISKPSVQGNSKPKKIFGLISKK